MDVGRILSRSLELLWKHKFLLVFGFVMGLTGGAGGNASGRGDFGAGTDAFTPTPFQNLRIEPGVIIAAVVVGLVLLLLWAILFFYVRFVSRGALVSGVREIEEHGSSSLREAWKDGRTYYARLLGLGFLVNVPLALGTLVIFALAFIPFIGLLISTRGQLGDAARAFPIVLGLTGILAICAAVGCVLLVHLVVHPLYELAVRAIVLEDLHVREGIKRGIAQARANAGNVILVYVALVGARIAWALVTAVIAIPVVLVLVLAVFGLMQTDLNAVILLVLIALIPLWLLFGAVEGVFQTFESNVWTEAYLSLLKKEPAA